VKKKTGTYIGVAGYKHLHEVVASDNFFRKAIEYHPSPIATELKLMIGILVSSKTLSGATNRWSNVYAPVSQIPELTTLNPNHLLYTVHYNTDDAVTVDEQIDQIMQLSSTIDAIQLNISWVNPIKIQKVRRKYPNLRIILQIGLQALKDINTEGDIYLGDALRAYAGDIGGEAIIDDFLIDQSEGNKRPIDVWRTFACIADVKIPTGIHAGVAGGLRGETVRELRGLIRRLQRPLNMDAQGGVRDDAEAGGNMVLEKVNRYIWAGVAENSHAANMFMKEKLT
jgi:hypothetical protein